MIFDKVVCKKIQQVHLSISTFAYSFKFWNYWYNPTRWEVTLSLIANGSEIFGPSNFLCKLYFFELPSNKSKGFMESMKNNSNLKMILRLYKVARHAYLLPSNRPPTIRYQWVCQAYIYYLSLMPSCFFSYCRESACIYQDRAVVLVRARAVHKYCVILHGTIWYLYLVPTYVSSFFDNTATVATYVAWLSTNEQRLICKSQIRSFLSFFEIQHALNHRPCSLSAGARQ